jgi:hypothetical protein
MFAFVATASGPHFPSSSTAPPSIWAAAVRHRRRAHRFPTRLEATYTPAGQQLPRRRAIIHDLNTFGLALSSNDTLELGANLDVTIMLDDIQATVSGTVARVHTAPDATTAVGLAFDPLPASTSDAIARWCFSHPFGPDIDISPTGLTDAVAEAA